MKPWFLRLLAGGTDDGNVGLFLLRVFTGAAMLTHGVPKLIGGPGLWRGVGAVMGSIGAPGPAVFWGLMAALAEGVAAFTLALGFLSRASAAMVAFTMTVAAFIAHHGDPFAKREPALLYLAITLAFALKGGGKYSLDRAIGWGR